MTHTDSTPSSDSSSAIPAPAFPEPKPSTLTLIRWLGYGGLIPFLAPVGALLLDVHHGVIYLQIQQAYGAVILSFVGALHWGIAMSRADLPAEEQMLRFLWSVIPALIAWPAVVLGGGWASSLLAFGFVAHYLQDRLLARRLSLPAWYLPLRVQLTAVAVLALIGSAILARSTSGWLPTSWGAIAI